MTPEQSYAYERLEQRAAVLDAPLVCSSPVCMEALPPAPPWEEAERDRVQGARVCPRCGEAMYIHMFARAVPRELPSRDESPWCDE